MGIDSLVTVNFFLAYRVFTTPAEQQFDTPLVEGGVTFLAEHNAPRCIVVCAPGDVGVAHSHIEIRAGVVAFIFVGRFVDISALAAVAVFRFADYGYSVCPLGASLDLAERVVALSGVGFAVGGEQVVDIFVCIILSFAPPAVGYTVLDVHAAMAVACRTAVVTVDVPPSAVGAHIGVNEDIPRAGAV